MGSPSNVRLTSNPTFDKIDGNEEARHYAENPLVGNGSTELE
jgi:hypothetical protein